MEVEFTLLHFIYSFCVGSLRRLEVVRPTSAAYAWTFLVSFYPPTHFTLNEPFNSCP